MLNDEQVKDLILKGKISLDRTATVRDRREAIREEYNTEILEYLVFSKEMEHLIKLSAIRRICQLQLLKFEKAEEVLCEIARDCQVLEYRVMAIEYIKSITSLHTIRYSSKDKFIVSLISKRMDDIHLMDKLFVHSNSSKALMMAHMDKFNFPSALEEIALKFDDDYSIIDHAIILISKLHKNLDEQFHRFYGYEKLIERIHIMSIKSISSYVKVSANLFLHSLTVEGVETNQKYEHILVSTVLNSKDYKVRIGLLNHLKSNELQYVLTGDPNPYVRRRAAKVTKSKISLNFALSQEKNIFNKFILWFYLIFR